ncbi:MAG: putative metal-dependent hydrolase of the TIM-barrel fold protein [Sphingomonas bacterium]|uniref:amidohydrolase family protein n=1 Tax=Sphingomonas bacterium TaxID=1895847 RepID=UPI0026292044|nr:amidohydrolase family protein [Sphingomonas bacterium]MDB5705020.1 putative metal-dependent hydrolase of the TIM-barrel fold protein [Sphingomonas bacterium]
MTELPDRRTILTAGLGALGTAVLPAIAQAKTPAIPIIDTHIHLFDGTRPQGAPYLGSKAYAAKTNISLPAGYRPLARPTGIVGAVAVEASAWIEDNLWLLEVAQADPMIVGVVGRLDPTKAEFAEYLGRYHKNPLYRGIRYSRFYTADGGKIALNPAAVDGLKLLAEADLVLDTANPSMNLMQASVLLADAVPNLRIIADHLAGFDPKPEEQAAYDATIKELAARPNIMVKLSQVYHPKPDGIVSTDYEPIRARLDYLLAAFGEDRVMFGSDYPNSYGITTIPQAVALMQRFYATKSHAAAEKYFWRNSARIYKWIKRAADQPTP